jgi:hypothetical protein
MLSVCKRRERLGSQSVLAVFTIVEKIHGEDGK